jgi:hypothetical protein
VFRYSVRLPKEHWFGQKEEENVYWLSIVAVYKDVIPERYRWGWTNHEHLDYPELPNNDDAVVGVVGPDGVMQWEELYDQLGQESVDMSFILFTEPGCFPSWYTTYQDWLTYGKPDCWCNSADIPGTIPVSQQEYDAGDYQCDGDTNTDWQNAFLKWRISAIDLNRLIASWKLPIATADPCADVDHVWQNPFLKWRVSATDLNILISNWKKDASQLPGNCPRPE